MKIMVVFNDNSDGDDCSDYDENDDMNHENDGSI